MVLLSRSTLALASALAFALTLAPSTPVVAADAENTDEAEAPADVASVKVELKQASGKVLKYDGAKLEFGADGNITFKHDDHVHDVSLRIDRAEEGSKSISLTVGYTKDGNAIIAPQTVSSEIKKREVISIEGGVAIAITVSAKSTKGEKKEEPPPAEEAPAPEEPPPPKKKDKILDGGGNDPLDGL